MNTIGPSLDFPSTIWNWCNAAPNPSNEASQSSLQGLVKSGCNRTGASGIILRI